MYDDETGRIRVEHDADARISMNQSDVFAVFQEFYDKPNFGHYEVIQRTSTLIFGPAGTGKI